MKAAREQAGIPARRVQELTDVNAATLYRIETARVRPQRRTVTQLLDAYGTPADRRAELLDLLKQSGEQGWLAGFEAELPELLTHYVNFESDARSVRNFETIFVPGLLQTRDYARATVTQAGLPIAREEDVERRVEVRMQRQALLHRDPPLELWCIVDEAVLHRVVGGVAVTVEQLKHVVEAQRAANVIVQVIPFSAGAHAGMPGSFVILDFPDPQDPELVYTDSMAGDLFLETEANIRRFTAVFDLLRASAWSPEDSTRLIVQRIAELEKGLAP